MIKTSSISLDLKTMDLRNKFTDDYLFKTADGERVYEGDCVFFTVDGDIQSSWGFIYYENGLKIATLETFFSDYVCHNVINDIGA